MDIGRRILRAIYEIGVENPLNESLIAAVAAIKFDATALPVESIRFVSLVDGLLLDVVMNVPDRDVRDRVEWITVARSLICPWIVLERNGAEYVVGWLRETIANLMAHEVAESLLYRSKRVFDPHAL